MKKVLVSLILLISCASAEINEHKVDLYYANGIMMQDSEYVTQVIWERRVATLLAQHEHFMDKIAKTDIAYNISESEIEDLWEAFLQKVSLDPILSAGWTAFKFFVSRIPVVGQVSESLIKYMELSNQKLHDTTLNEQIQKYKDSILSGHGVVVVAHSQGNLFAIEAYRKLDTWMKQYFHMIAVATPADRIVNGGNGVTFDNDIILSVPLAMDNSIYNPNRYDYLEHTYNAVNEIIDTQLHIDAKTSVQYHSFSYYLGYPIHEFALAEGSDTQTLFEKRQTNVAKNLIEQWIIDEIEAHETRESQWMYDTNSSDSKVF